MVKINKLLNLMMMMMIMRTLLINAVIKTVILVLWIHITKKKTSRTIIENNIFIEFYLKFMLQKLNLFHKKSLFFICFISLIIYFHSKQSKFF
jgi:hypothetical protein